MVFDAQLPSDCVRPSLANSK